MTLVEGNEICSQDEKTDVLNLFFSKVAKNLKISNYQNPDHTMDTISLLALKEIVKKSNYTSVIAIKYSDNGPSFDIPVKKKLNRALTFLLTT